MTAPRTLALFSLLVVGAACAEATSAPAIASSAPLTAEKPYLPGERQPDVLGSGALAIHQQGVGQILAQTFTPQSNQLLGYIELPVTCSENVDLVVKVTEGLNGPVLHEVFVFGLTGSVQDPPRLIQLFDPAGRGKGIRLKKGTEYAFVLSSFPLPGATGTTCGIAKGPVGDSYAEGRAYYQDPVNGPTFLPLPNGQPTDEQDLPFTTFIR